MSDRFDNVYADPVRAEAYAGLELPGTYYLAYRDLPSLLGTPPPGATALDFGCGTGRSSRFLRQLGFERVVGADISEAMLAGARQRDPEGDYRLVRPGDLAALRGEAFDLVFCSFTFDNVPMEDKPALFAQFRRQLAPGGRVVNLVSAPEIYVHEWTSFSTRDFPANRDACTGDPVHIVMLDVEDRRPVQDVFCTDADYRALYAAAGLAVVDVHRPLGRPDDPFEWVSESDVSPWAIYSLTAA